MIHSSHDIDQLLERYYDGLSTPDEEFVLYLALLQEEPGSPYYADRMLLEATLQRAASQTKSATPAPLAGRSGCASTQLRLPYYSSVV